MLERIITGGQTGADQAAWRAAKAFGIPTGGWMPKGFLTEDGPRPEFAELYGAQEMPTPSYPPRTLRNVLESDATLWFGRDDTPGAQVTFEARARFGKDGMRVCPGLNVTPTDVFRWLEANPQIRTLNIAGNRESKDPGIGDRVERFLCAVFRQLGYKEVAE